MICPKCETEMVFQPELFDPGRGEYVCGCGRSGRVFEEKRPAGVGTRQVAVKEHDVSISQGIEAEKSKVRQEKMEPENEKEPKVIRPAPPKPERPKQTKQTQKTSETIFESWFTYEVTDHTFGNRVLHLIQADSKEKVKETIQSVFTRPEIHSIDEVKTIRPRTQFRTEEAYWRQFNEIHKQLKQFREARET